MSNTPIADAADAVKKYIPAPWMLTGALGLTTYGVSRLAWGPSVETLRSLGRPVVSRMFADGTAQGIQDTTGAFDESIDELKADPAKKRTAPAAIGAATFLAGLTAFARPDLPYYGLDAWASRQPLIKEGSMFLDDNAGASYVNQLDYARQVPLNTADRLFTSDPHLADHDYARRFGQSIVHDAAIREKTKSPTIGGIFDSAVNKIENKLTFGGVTQTAIRTAVANGGARLFAGALGSMCGLPESAQKKLIDAGTWAGAITAIFE